MRIGGMVWGIGTMLDFHEQIRWFRRQGFDGVAFHAAPCFDGGHAVFDVRRASADERRALKEALAGFGETSVHGEFDNYDVCLSTPNELVRRASVETLRRSIELAAVIGAKVVTTHEGSTRTGAPDEVRRAAFAVSMAELAAMAGDAGVTIGLELTRDYDLALAAPAGVGVTLDTGHVSMANGTGYREFGTIGGLVRHLGKRLVHVHVHDYDGRKDHIAIGAGKIDFPEMVRALEEIGYAGMLCMELNPGATTPEDYPRGRDALLAMRRRTLGEAAGEAR